MSGLNQSSTKRPNLKVPKVQIFYPTPFYVDVAERFNALVLKTSDLEGSIGSNPIINANILESRQVERQQTLTLFIVGSNPASPASLVNNCAAMLPSPVLSDGL